MTERLKYWFCSERTHWFFSSIFKPWLKQCAQHCIDDLYQKVRTSYQFLGKSSSHICGRIQSWPCLWDKMLPGHRHHDEYQCQCRAHVDDTYQRQKQERYVEMSCRPRVHALLQINCFIKHLANSTITDAVFTRSY